MMILIDRKLSIFSILFTKLKQRSKHFSALFLTSIVGVELKPMFKTYLM